LAIQLSWFCSTLNILDGETLELQRYGTRQNITAKDESTTPPIGSERVLQVPQRDLAALELR
jgi:hypothetical protein